MATPTAPTTVGQGTTVQNHRILVIAAAVLALACVAAVVIAISTSGSNQSQAPAPSQTASRAATFDGGPSTGTPSAVTQALQSTPSDSFGGPTSGTPLAVKRAFSPAYTGH